ncbi:hypothetical protein AZF37_04180 [endosymbiont 'TC1' of Trimyema compressum]|uniref:hypothetical protein n=1 Tax=endosymbiont 'TC1' of Trimyema compressum TaxID=243899 RepID=UPI0007F0B2B0|nr:hypothetical protein [endosymbiont 'TC1' of Trimyema compressum]AMP20472.1 hypothetical protein AZF37_04180 [endosymbiont 'TC1' of Trimyema compressum]
MEFRTMAKSIHFILILNFGRQLMESTFNCLQEKYDVVDVWVLKENKRAIDFYEAQDLLKAEKKKI